MARRKRPRLTTIKKEANISASSSRNQSIAPSEHESDLESDAFLDAKIYSDEEYYTHDELLELAKKDPLALIKMFDLVPAISYFCHNAGPVLGLPQFGIAELEEALLIDKNKESKSALITDILIGFAKGLNKKFNRPVKNDNYNQTLCDILNKEWRYVANDENANNPLGNIIEEADFHALPLHVKIILLNEFIELRLASPYVMDVIDQVASDDLRISLLGENATSEFWYFHGTRLYTRQKVKAKKISRSKKRLTKPQPKTEPVESNIDSDDDENEGDKNSSSQKKKPENLDTTQNIDGLDEKMDCSQLETNPAKCESQTGEVKAEDESSDKDGSIEKMERIVDPWRQDYFRPIRTYLNGWAVVCSKKHEWHSLHQMIGKSRNSTEKLLRKCLEEEFLPYIDDLYKNEDDQRREREAEFAARRQSERQEKLRQMRQEEKILRERVLRQRKTTAKALENLEEEQRQSIKNGREERARQRQFEKERREKFEHLAYQIRDERLKLKQENSEQYEDQYREDSDDSNYESTEDRNLGINRIIDELETMYNNMQRVLQAVKNDTSAAPFQKPVEIADAPDYSNIIKEPMDLSTIQLKLDEKAYTFEKEFVEDFQLMLLNCLKYNGVYHELTKNVRGQDKTFVHYWRKWMSPNERDSVFKFQAKLDIINNKLSRIESEYRRLTGREPIEKPAPTPKVTKPPRLPPKDRTQPAILPSNDEDPLTNFLYDMSDEEHTLLSTHRSTIKRVLKHSGINYMITGRDGHQRAFIFLDTNNEPAQSSVIARSLLKIKNDVDSGCFDRGHVFTIKLASESTTSPTKAINPLPAHFIDQQSTSSALNREAYDWLDSLANESRKNGEPNVTYFRTGDTRALCIKATAVHLLEYDNKYQQNQVRQSPPLGSYELEHFYRQNQEQTQIMNANARYRIPPDIISKARYVIKMAQQQSQLSGKSLQQKVSYRSVPSSNPIVVRPICSPNQDSSATYIKPIVCKTEIPFVSGERVVASESTQNSIKVTVQPKYEANSVSVIKNEESSSNQPIVTQMPRTIFVRAPTPTKLIFHRSVPQATVQPIVIQKRQCFVPSPQQPSPTKIYQQVVVEQRNNDHDSQDLPDID